MDDAAAKAYVDSIMSASSGTVNPIIGTTSSGLTLSTAGHILLGTTFPSLSIDEERELALLEEEHKQNLKIERIRIFKSMPSAMRQNVVDSIIFKEYIAEIENPNLVTSTRLNELRRKDYRININDQRDYWATVDQHSKLLNFLSEEEILNAHAEQSLEDSLLNTKTN